MVVGEKYDIEYYLNKPHRISSKIVNVDGDDVNHRDGQCVMVNVRYDQRRSIIIHHN